MKFTKYFEEMLGRGERALHVDMYRVLATICWYTTCPLSAAHMLSVGGRGEEDVCG